MSVCLSLCGVCSFQQRKMSESGAEAAPAAAKELLALNPAQESDFRKKVQEVKKKKSGKVGETCGLEGDPIVCSYFPFVYCR